MQYHECIIFFEDVFVAAEEPCACRWTACIQHVARRHTEYCTRYETPILYQNTKHQHAERRVRRLTKRCAED